MRGSPRLALVGVCLLLAASCGDNLKPPEQSQPPAPTGPTGQPAVAAWMRFAPDLQAAEHGRFQDQFALYEQRDVFAVIAVPDGGGVRKLRVDLVGPGEAVLDRRLLGFATDPSPPDVIDNGAGLQIPVVEAKSTRGRARLHLPIPIAGTQAARFHLVGQYRVDVYLEGGATPVVTGTFELRGVQ